MRVRLLRLCIERFMHVPELTYLVQLSFSRGDTDWSMPDQSNINTNLNVVRDAAFYYRPSKKFTLTFGQVKLPGNRQRVIPFGEQQFIDRSIVNTAFNIDRDFGIRAHYLNRWGNSYYMAKGTPTTGESRNMTPATEVAPLERRQEAFVDGLAKYIRRHRLKLQTNIAYHNSNAFAPVNTAYHWTGALQMELGI